MIEFEEPVANVPRKLNTASFPMVAVPDNLNPYQGLKPLATQQQVVCEFQTIWIPIRDWNFKNTSWSPDRASSRQSESLSGIETSWVVRKPERKNWSSRQSESLSGIETLHPALASNCRAFQTIWIPIRDWNHYLKNPKGGRPSSRQSESLSGIETQKIFHLCTPLQVVPDNLNPYQGLKP